MNHHTMSTDENGQPTFTCTDDATASCHIWADCLSTDGCESGDADCKHEKVQHETCIYSEWYQWPADTIAMYVNEDGDDGGPLPVNVAHGRIRVEWDECPLWSFDPLTHGASTDPCPEWNCPDLSTEDRREGKTCPEHPCACSDE